MAKILYINTDISSRNKLPIGPYADQFTFAKADDFACYLETGKDPVVYFKGAEKFDFDLIHFRVWKHRMNVTLPVYAILKAAQLPLHKSEIDRFVHANKVYETLTFHQLGLKIPNTVYIPRARIIKHLDVLKKHIAYPCVMKNIEGREGEVNYIVNSDEDVKKYVEQHPDVQFIFQEFIDNEFDYRFFILGHETKRVYRKRRDPKSTSHLNNVAQGASVELVDLDSDTVQKLNPQIEKATRKLGRDICGFDILESTSGEHYFLEANANPGMKSFDVDVLFAEYLVSLAEANQES